MGHLTSLSPKVEMICVIDLVFVNSSNIYKFQHIVVYTKLPTNKERGCEPVAPGFKNKTRYTPYVSPGSQISHIATNKGNIKRQCLNT